MIFSKKPTDTPDKSAAALAAIHDPVLVFRFHFLKIPAPHAIDLLALGAVTFPQLLPADGQVAVTAAEPLLLLLDEHKFLMSARCHELEDTGLKSETQAGYILQTKQAKSGSVR